MNNDPKSDYKPGERTPEILTIEEQLQIKAASKHRNSFLGKIGNFTLRTKMLFILVIVVVLAVGAVAFFTNLTTRLALIEEVDVKLLGAASQTAASVDSFIQTNLDAVKAEAQLPDFVAILGPADQRRENIKPSTTLISLNGKNGRYISSYAILNTAGVNVADSNGMNVGESEANRDYFQMAVEKGHPYVSPVLFSPDTNQGYIYFSSPVRNAVGEILGVLRVAYRVEILQKLVAENTAGEGLFAVLFDENRLHLAHSDEKISVQTNYKLVALPNLTTLAKLQAAGRVPQVPVDDVSTQLFDLDQKLANLDPDTPYFEAEDITDQGKELNQVAVAPMNTQPWQLAVFQPKEVLFKPVAAQTQNIVLLAVLISVVVAGVAVVASRQLSQPIVRLTKVAEQVSKGNLDARASVESTDEIGQLSAVFNSMTGQLQNMVKELEDQVQKRTADLLLSIEVGQQAAAIRDLDKLLPVITELIRNQFNLYHVQVYLMDDTRKNLVVQSGTGAIGAQMLAYRHRFVVGAGSIVGQVAAQAQSIVVSDTQKSSVYPPNPLLPGIHSELALPLIVEDHVIGVLAMQARTENTFTETNLTVFEAMATQLAISIDSAQQWDLAQNARQKSEQALAQLTRQAWTERLGAQKETMRFVYDLSSVSPLESTEFNGQITAPVLVQNQSIGQLAVTIPEDRTLSEDERALLNAVSRQLAQKAETLRLFEETQQQATREQLARRITDKVRASRDIETALNTAAKELADALGASKATINLQIKPSNE